MRPAGDRQLTEADRVPAGLADRDRVELGPARVPEHDRLRARVAVPVAPLLEREQDRVQLVAGVGQQILVPRRAIGVAAALDHARLLERAQPAREHVARRAGAGGDVVEARVAVADLARDEQRVAVADDRQRVGDRADSRRLAHGGSLLPTRFGFQTSTRKASMTTDPAIVLIHGFWVTPRSWEDWIARYEGAGHRVLAPAYPASR